MAPFDQRGVALVAVAEAAAVEGHEQRARDLPAIVRDVQVHRQVLPLPFLVQVPDDAAVNHVLRLLYPVHRLPIHLPHREKMVFRRLIRRQRQFLRLQVDAYGIGPDGARIAVHQCARHAERIDIHAHEAPLRGVQPGLDAARAGEGEGGDNAKQYGSESLHAQFPNLNSSRTEPPSSMISASRKG